MAILKKQAGGDWQPEDWNAAIEQTDLRVVSLAEWLDEKESGQAEEKPATLRLSPADDFGMAAAEVTNFDRIEIEFPSFADGRGYSQARLLRRRYGYDGELRAVGDIRRDELDLLNRCGFNSLELPADVDLTDALKAFDEITVCYQ